MKICPLATAAALGLSGLAVHAFPIAFPGTEGLSVIVSSSSEVVATYQGNSAAYSNHLSLELDSLGKPGLDGDLSNDLFIFNNQASRVGSNLSLGLFDLGSELVFQLHVNNTA